MSKACFITPKWTYQMEPSLQATYAPSVGRVGDKIYIACPGSAHPPDKGGRLYLLDKDGNLLWSIKEKYALSPWVAFVDIYGDGDKQIAYWTKAEDEWQLKVVRAVDGSLVWQRTDSPWTGNGDFIDSDIDGDGVKELIYAVGGIHHWVVCCDATTGEEKWRYSDRVSVCWGRSAIGDIDNDGSLEIVFGTEYANPDSTSSMIALRNDGSLLWRYDKMEGDAGSTPTILADVDNDGYLEILKTEIDLCGQGPVHIARLWCFENDGEVKYKVDFGGRGIAVADIDGDGILEGVGITTGRDGGHNIRPQVICFNLADGSQKWRTPVPRIYLSTDAVIAHLDDDGAPEIIVGTGMPSGYGRIPNQPIWGDIYVINSRGKLIWKTTLPDCVGNPVVCDFDEDGYNEILIACSNGKLYTWDTAGPSSDSEFPLANKEMWRWSHIDK